MEAPSEFYLITDTKGSIIATHSKLGDVGEDAFLQRLCEEYYDKLGVEGYMDYFDYTMWYLHGEWYTESQIQRMLRLKAFA